MKTMKTSFRFFVVIAVAAITVFSMAGCNINVTTSSGTPAPKTPVAGDFTVSNLTQYADNITAVTVTPKSGKSGGALTVYYDGATSLPTAAGTYTVTFDVAAVSGWNAAVGLHGGTLTIIPPGQTPVDGLEEIADYLSTAEGGESTEDSVYLLVNIDLGNMTDGTSGWQQLLDAIDDADKFIELDLSLCEMNGTEFEPISSLSTGKDKVISLTLPAAAESITNGSYGFEPFKNFDNLKTVNGACITAIGNYAFNDCSNLTDVSIPLAVSIGSVTFYGCSSLAEVSFPLAKSIDSYAFSYCTSLTEANFPLAESIGNTAFEGCSNLTEVHFPLAVSIGRYTFNFCNSLTEVNIPLAESIGERAFAYCSSLTEASFPLAESIGVSAFRDCISLTGVNIPLAESIGSEAFINCSSLTEAVFPLAVSIGDFAFYACSLTEAYFPLVERIGEYAFLLCDSLSSITIAADCDIDSNAQIRGNFSDYYDSQLKAAGTYIYDDGAWTGPQ